LWCRCRPRDTAGTAAGPGGLLLVRLERRPRTCCDAGGRRCGAVLAKAFLGLLLGLELGLEVVLAALLLLGPAPLGFLAFDPLGLLARLAEEFFLFSDLALLRLGRAGVMDRVNAGLLPGFGQAGQDQAAGGRFEAGRGRRGRRGRRGGGWGRGFAGDGTLSRRGGRGDLDPGLGRDPA